ncbi:MAG: chorismate synthase [Sphingobacterium sp.]|nr:chorismate synthase [Sphingobacterium sp.]
MLDGVPPGMMIDVGRIQSEVDHRRPKADIGTPRQEEDKVEVVSGIVEGRSTGGPITLMVMNRDTDSKKYEKFKERPAPRTCRPYRPLEVLGVRGPSWRRAVLRPDDRGDRGCGRYSQDAAGGKGNPRRRLRPADREGP